MNYVSKGPRIFLVESDFLVANDLMYALENEGMVIACVSSSPEGALKQLEYGAFDFALINLRLRDVNCYPIAEKLKDLDVPFAFFTGATQAESDVKFQDIPWIEKPKNSALVAQDIKNIITSAASIAVEVGRLW